MKCEKLGNHTISYQSLLLSTTVLNDTYYTWVTHVSNKDVYHPDATYSKGKQ